MSDTDLAVPDNSSTVTFTIRADGKEIPSTWDVVAIETWHAANPIPRARIELFDGTPASAGANFEISSSRELVPGSEVSIDVGYDSDESRVFSGVVVKQRIEITGNRGSKLTVDLADRALEMTLVRKNAVFENGGGEIDQGQRSHQEAHLRQRPEWKREGDQGRGTTPSCSITPPTGT